MESGNGGSTSNRCGKSRTVCCKRKRQEEKARRSDLQPGDRVLIRHFAERGGPGKLRSFWEDKIYIIKNRKGPDSPVYEITPENGTGRTRTVDRNLLLPCPCLPYEAPKQVKTEPIRKKLLKLANHTPESTTLIDKVEEYDFETFLPSQLAEMEHSFPNIFDNNSLGERVIKPSVVTLPVDKNVPDLPEPKVGSPPSEQDSNVSALRRLRKPPPVPKNMRMRGHDTRASLPWYYRIITPVTR